MNESQAPAAQQRKRLATTPAGRPANLSKAVAGRPGPADPARQRPEPPRSVLAAVRLMYTGAALTAIGLVISVIAIAAGKDQLRASHPHATAAQLHATQSFLITAAVVSALLEIGGWIFMARANRLGLKWARIAATVLFGLSTWNLVSHLFGTVTIGNIIYSVVTWLVGLAAVVFLWLRESSRYFSAGSAAN